MNILNLKEKSKKSISIFQIYLNCATEWQEDSGEIREKEHLPVKAVRFGDTGTPLDEKQGRYTLGPLMCEGDDLFNNVVTFRVTDATINLPTFDMGHSGDVYFEFKTTIENAVLFHAKVGRKTNYSHLNYILTAKINFFLCFFFVFFQNIVNRDQLII